MTCAGIRSNRRHLQPCHGESSDPRIPDHYGEVRTHASCETVRTWVSFDHRELEYRPYRRITVQISFWKIQL